MMAFVFGQRRQTESGNRVTSDSIPKYVLSLILDQHKLLWFCIFPPPGISGCIDGPRSSEFPKSTVPICQYAHACGNVAAAHIYAVEEKIPRNTEYIFSSGTRLEWDRDMMAVSMKYLRV